MSSENSVKSSKDSKAYQRLVKNLTIDLLWIWVLKLLREKPKYAYQLKQEIQERFNFSPATVTNYTILYLLEREGLVEKTEMRNSDERIDRKYYVITKFGEEVMNEAELYLKQIYEKLFSKEIDS
ncbi:MAG: helix-turn-helix transcriptional regulator [Candidatus Heimdallarchaeota archaeon]|nr:helix-turn-helix transcriptional regulator [Candidatus Heimdallarchaeota archaeon]MCG3255001.1 helix-turn-helix transcriptional regulator [Candidatus Heimdallarchaeota archaeon]MCK4610075.1 helix-turn-helix transcriptional regulator [Candidatus Heimdallarchaeota archaeon]